MSAGAPPPIRRTLSMMDRLGTRAPGDRSRTEESTNVGPRVVSLAEHLARTTPVESDPTPLPQRPAIERAARLADRGLYPARPTLVHDATAATKGSGLLTGPANPKLIIDGPKTPFAELFGRTQAGQEPTPPAAYTDDPRRFDKNEMLGVMRGLRIGTPNYDMLDDAIMRIVRICDTKFPVSRSDFEKNEMANPTRIKDLLGVFLDLDWTAILAQNVDTEKQRSLRSMFNSAVRFSLTFSPTGFVIPDLDHLTLLDDKTLDLAVSAPSEFLFSEPQKTVLLLKLMHGKISADETMRLLDFRRNYYSLMEQVIRLKKSGRHLPAATTKCVEVFTMYREHVAEQVSNLEKRIQALNRR